MPAKLPTLSPAIRAPCPLGPAAWVRQRLPQRWLRRLVAVVVLLVFAPMVNAMLVCEVHCIAQALSAGADAGAGAGHAERGEPTEHGSAPHLLDAGPCHLAATPILAGAPELAAPGVVNRDEWVASAADFFVSIAWPPPRPPPKFSLS